MSKVRKIEITYVKWRCDFESILMYMNYFNEGVITFFENYGYRVTQSDVLIKFKNKKYVPVPVCIGLMLIGTAGIVLGIMSTYKLLLLCVLLVFIPLLKILNQGPKYLLIDLLKKSINHVEIAQVERFQFSSSEQNAHATPFEKGTIEYILNLEMITKEGSTIQLATFTNREKNKESSHEVLVNFNAILHEQV